VISVNDNTTTSEFKFQVDSNKKIGLCKAMKLVIVEPQESDMFQQVGL